MYVGDAGQPAAGAGLVSKEECRHGDADGGVFSTDLTGASQGSAMERFLRAVAMRGPTHGGGVGESMEMSRNPKHEDYGVGEAKEASRDPKHEDYGFCYEIALCRRTGISMGMPLQFEVGGAERHALKLQSSERPPDRILKWLKEFESCPTESLLIALKHIVDVEGRERQVHIMSQFLCLSTFQESDRAEAIGFFEKLGLPLRE